MRIVHEIEYPCQVGGGSPDPYVISKSEVEKGRTSSKGFRLDELLIAVSPNRNPLIPEDAIYLDGDAACILDALEKACGLIRWVGEDLVKEGKLDPDWKNLKSRFPAAFWPEGEPG